MATSKQTDKPKGATVGYPEVEKLIDSENFDHINEAFETAYKELSVISRQKRGLKRSKDAKKAMRAIEHVVDLFKELLEMKYELTEMLDRAAKNKKKK